MNETTELTDALPRETPLARAARAMDALRALHAYGPPDRDALLAWPGWGALTPAFETTPKGTWLAIADELDDLISADDLAIARDHLDTSFYTPANLVSTVFDILAATGFTGGKVLEPGCGSGRFMAATPAGLNIQWTGVEIDPTSASMAAALVPSAKIINQPMQKTPLITGQFDAVIGNVPFSKSTVHDPNFPAASLHKYFLLRSVDAVREGGYVIAITSRFTMDAATGLDSVLGKDETDTGAELMAAIRLPSGAFASEGTQVVTDILVFRKRAAGEPYRGWDDARENAITNQSARWPYTYESSRLQITEPAVPGTAVQPVEVNAYWAKHPEHVAGTMKLTTFQQNPVVVIADDPEAATAAAVAAAITHLVPQTERREFDAARELADVKLFDADGRKEGSFHLVDGIVHEVIDGQLAAARNTAELRALILLRDAALDLLALESDFTLPDSAIDATREAALTTYLAYVKAYGPLNRGILSIGKDDPDTGEPTQTWRRPALGGFRRDPSYVSVMALEQFNQDDGEASPAPILLRRVNHAPIPVERVETPSEALSVSQGEGRGVDLHRIAGLLGLDSEAAAADALGDLVFTVADTLVDARDYLSGNVRVKLSEARRLAAADVAYQRNVDALAAVLPADLGPLDIRVSLGAPFVSVADVNDFASEVLGGYAYISHTPEVAVWEFGYGSRNASSSHSARLAYGTQRLSPMQILDSALNGKTITVYDDSYDGYKVVKVRNIAETIAAAEKMSALDDRFSTWVWEDADRAARIQTEYNERFNSHVTRRADGSHLIFPGLSETVTPWPHQRDAVDRIVSSERTLIGHPVGSGKTLSIILAAMTLRRFGLAQKPLITVPNHLLDQIVREAQQAFPTAKFLIAAKEDLTADRRRLFAARCATGDWDAVVMTHGVFTSLPVSPEVEEAWVQEQKSELRAALSDSGSSNGKGAKAIARSVRTLEAKLSSLRYGNQDADQIVFDHLGVDHIMVDEGHLFRRLANGSTSRDNGFSSGSSKRATDMLLKIETLARKFPGKPVVSMFTGTPWANTLAETWTWQRYLQPEALEAAGVKQFDPWVASFVKYENAVEVSPDGSGFRMQKRPVGMKNLPELLTMFGQVADIVSADSLGLERPAHTEHNIVSNPTPQQFDYVKGLAERAEATRGGRKGQRPDGGGDDSMLIICNDGRKVALDPQLVGIDERSAKIVDAAAIIAGIYEKTKGYRYGESTTLGAAQLALLDLGTPHPGDAQVYGRLRGMLVGHGVPAEKIRFIHEAKTDKARAAMFAQAREGGIAVLLGSTSKVGIGTNIQTRLIALHHIDAPWTPAEVEQREGRALRPKNLNAHVDIYRYVTESTFDAYLWQALQRKASSFAKLYASDASDREIEDISSVSMSYGEVKALAAGNPLLLDQAKVASEVSKLRLLRSVHLQGVNRARQRADACRNEIDARTRESAKLRSALELTALHSGDEIRDAEGISRLAEMIATKDTTARHQVGVFHGLGLRISSRAGADRRGVVLSILNNYTEIDSIEISGQVQRRGVEGVAETLLATLCAWEARGPQRLAANTSAVARLAAEATEADATVESAVFEHEYQLEFAIRRQVEIDDEINAQAIASEPARQAA